MPERKSISAERLIVAPGCQFFHRNCQLFPKPAMEASKKAPDTGAILGRKIK